jgi:hypothetical protein
MNTAGSLIRVGSLGISDSLLWRNFVSGTSTVVGLGVKLGCRKVFCSRKAFGARFLVDKKSSNVCAFVDGRRTVPNKLLMLRIILQRHVRLKKTIDQFFLLVLGMYAAQTSC